MSEVIDKLPHDQRQVLTSVATALRSVTNVVALVLGGSHAAGLARQGSDLDIGVYYREAAPLAVAEVRTIAESVSAPGFPPVVTELYGWGPWVNGGAWIQTAATKLDLVYRNLDQVHGVIEEGRRGVWRHDYDQQPPHGFRSIVYFAETHCCVPLHDPAGVIGELEALVAHYPEPLKARVVQDCLWGAEFSMWSCAGFAASADVCNAVSCMTRTSQYLIHSRVLARLPRDSAELRASLASLHQIWVEVVALSNRLYQPRFRLAAATAIPPR